MGLLSSVRPGGWVVNDRILIIAVDTFLSLRKLKNRWKIKSGDRMFPVPHQSIPPRRGLRMITINQNQLDTVEYLIQQSAQGNHILFDLDLVRKVFSIKTDPMSEAQAREVESHIETLITLDTFEKQKAYVEALPEEVLYRVIKTYFNIVENNMFEKSPVRH
jgi:hypothetical protein